MNHKYSTYILICLVFLASAYLVSAAISAPVNLDGYGRYFIQNYSIKTSNFTSPDVIGALTSTSSGNTIESRVTVATNTTQWAKWVLRHNQTNQGNVMMIFGTTGSYGIYNYFSWALNSLMYGGGSSGNKAMQEHVFYTAQNDTTNTGDPTFVISHNETVLVRGFLNVSAGNVTLTSGNMYCYTQDCSHRSYYNGSAVIIE